MYVPTEHNSFVHIICLVRAWLKDWGNLLLSAIVAAAAVTQGIFAKRLYGLQETIEEVSQRPFLYSRLTGYKPFDYFTSISAQLANLSRNGIWIEELVVVVNGPTSQQPKTYLIQDILPSNETKKWEIFCMPFAELVPITSDMPKSPTNFQVQAKFYYSTSTVTGVWLSPICTVSVLNTVVTQMEIEPASVPNRKRGKTATLLAKLRFRRK